MSDGIMITIGDDGEAALYDDTYDITIHCESQEEQDEVKRVLQNVPHWIPVEQALPQIGEYVLCETTTRYFGKYHVCKFVDKDKWVDRPHFDWDRHGFPHVIAWMHFKGTEECKKREVTE